MTQFYGVRSLLPNDNAVHIFIGWVVKITKLFLIPIGYLVPIGKNREDQYKKFLNVVFFNYFCNGDETFLVTEPSYCSA